MVIDDIATLLIKYPGNSNLSNARTNVRNGVYKTGTEDIFKFQKAIKELPISNRIIGNLTTLLGLTGNSVTAQTVKSLRLTTLSQLSTVDRVTRLYETQGKTPTILGATSYSRYTEIAKAADEDIKNSLLTSAYWEWWTASKYLGQIW